MKPLINVEDITDFEGHDHGSFKAKYAVVGEKIGANQLGYNITIIPPGKKSYPFHNHHVNEEMFFILEAWVSTNSRIFFPAFITSLYFSLLDIIDAKN